ncbi:MAG: glycoside hydrolase family 127 protein, partial [Acidobacteriota bacterium]
MKKGTWLRLIGVGAILVALGVSCKKPVGRDYPFSAVPLTAVRFTDQFWAARLETNRKVTIPFALQQSETTGRIKNFEIAGGLAQGSFCSKYPFDDSDVYKIVEGAAYSLMVHPDPELEKKIDETIAKIAAAQEDDGYLYTARTIDPANPPVDWVGKERWSNLYMSHELYNLGHLYEAAVAHYKGTGKKNLLNVALKSADFVAAIFGPGKRHGAPGHQEIEIGLVKLFRLTGKKKYLNLAKFFLDERGNSKDRTLYGEYSQDHKPVTEQTEAVGHAVRAMYMYSGMADVAALTGDEAYRQALDRLWEDVVYKKTYVTGGIGAAGGIEGFGPAYKLPNAEAYCETCASIAAILWNHRMFLLSGDAKYIDILERTLYNAFLSGVGMSGDLFFYPNPLESLGQHHRSPWFNCACCPSNITRFVPEVPGFVYATQNDAVFVNLFAASESEFEVGAQKVRFTQQTHYPWDGEVQVVVSPERPAEFGINIRIPGWALGRPVPGDLYQYANQGEETVSVRVNGEPLAPELGQGYARLRRVWNPGDSIEISLPMPARRVVAHPQVEDDAGRVALERGPLVYCAEWPDNGGRVSHLVLPDDSSLSSERRDGLNGITVVRGDAVALYEGRQGQAADKRKQGLTAIPYYAWAHRGEGEMAVWLPREESKARPLPNPTIASQSTVSASGEKPGGAVNDQWEPRSSNDHSRPYLHWWPNKGTAEWVQYEFSRPATVSAVSIYWFDDTGQGECRVPAFWQVLSRQGESWVPVRNLGPYGVEIDTFNRV